MRVGGIENAYYSVSMQLIRDSEKDTEKEQDGYNELILKEGIEYEYVIGSEEKSVFQIHSI